MPIFYDTTTRFCSICNSQLKPRQKEYCCRVCADNARTEQSTQTRAIYELNPILCKHCMSPLTYEAHFERQFCNSSCSASFLNAHRTEEQNLRKNESISKTIQARNKHLNNPNKPPRSRHKFSSIRIVHCSKCDKLLTIHRGNVKYCSECKDTNVRLYRKYCSFKLNKRDHSSLYNSDLIKHFGWYSPASSSAPNLGGVTWDHLYRIEEGILNNVDVTIMSHPANAELVPWPINKARKQSMITLEDLLDRIKRWDSGDRNLEYFYKFEE